jgi:hypothetical protein
MKNGLLALMLACPLEHGYHDFVLGPQGQKRPDLPRGEVLLQGALDALDRAVAFVKSASPGASGSK